MEACVFNFAAAYEKVRIRGQEKLEAGNESVLEHEIKLLNDAPEVKAQPLSAHTEGAKAILLVNVASA